MQLADGAPDSTTSSPGDPRGAGGASRSVSAGSSPESVHSLASSAPSGGGGGAAAVRVGTSAVAVEPSRLPARLTDAEADAELARVLALLAAAPDVDAGLLAGVAEAARTITGAAGALVVERVAGGASPAGGGDPGDDDDLQPDMDSFTEPAATATAPRSFARVIAASASGALSAAYTPAPPDVTLPAGVGPLWRCWVRPPAPSSSEIGVEGGGLESGVAAAAASAEERALSAGGAPPDASESSTYVRAAPALPTARISCVLTSPDALALLAALHVVPRPGGLLVAPLQVDSALYEGTVERAQVAAAAAAERAAAEREEALAHEADAVGTEGGATDDDSAAAPPQRVHSDAATAFPGVAAPLVATSSPAAPVPVTRPRFLALMVDSLLPTPPPMGALPAPLGAAALARLEALASALGEALTRTEAAVFAREWGALRQRKAAAEARAPSALTEELAAEAGACFVGDWRCAPRTCKLACSLAGCSQHILM